MTQYQANIDLADLNGDNGFRLDGWRIWQATGWSVSSAGDVNGDGLDDIIVGTHGADDYAGVTTVIYGKTSGFDPHYNLGKFDNADGIQLAGVHSREESGLAVAGIGDINGDGIDDFIIGAPGAPTHFKGAAYVVFGQDGGLPHDLSLGGLNGTNGFRIDGVQDDQELGWAAAGAGDINGDGVNDMVIGTPGRGAYVVFGSASGFAADLSVGALNGANGFSIQGAGIAGAGFKVASAGDVNGDGFADIIVGAFEASTAGQYSGAAYVIYGKASGFDASISLADLNGTNGFRLDGAGANDFAGRTVGGADINGDGVSDLLISGEDFRYSTSGEAYVVFGTHAGFAADVPLADLNGTNGFRIVSDEVQDGFGYSVASAGDVNGDGFNDIVVGAINADGGGAAYVLFGKAGGFDAVIDVSTLDGTDGFRLTADPSQDGDVGFSVASAGDVNGDGLADLILGSPGSDPHGRVSGDAYVVFGVLPDAAVDRVGTAASQNLVGGNFNDKLQGLAGDDQLYGNGGKDKLVGGSGADTLRGGDGNDILSGGHGADVLTGGAGNNSFVFTSVADSLAAKADLITDLHKGDIIDLSRVDADTTQDGDQAFVRVDAFTGHAGQLVVSFDAVAGMTSFAGDVDGDGQADFLIEAAGKHDSFTGLVL